MNDIREGNIYDYFKLKLGRSPSDVTLRKLRVLTICGDDCRQAIDYAAALVKITDRAYSWPRNLIIDAVNDTIETFWRG